MRIYFLLLGVIVSGQRLDLCQREINEVADYVDDITITWPNGTESVIPGMEISPDYGNITVAECITECDIEFLDQKPDIISFMPAMNMLLPSYYDVYLIVIEADFGSALTNTDNIGFWKFDSDFCPNNFDSGNFRLVSIGHSQPDKFWFEASIVENQFFNRAYQFRTNVSEPIIFVVDVFSYSSINITEMKTCIQNSKMGVLSDGNKPFSNDYTGCAIGMEKSKNFCDEENCQLPKDSYCPGNQWFQNPAPPLQARIFNGEAAVRSSWPWIVSLSEPWSSSDKICGGQIVTDEWILTAGHCCAGSNLNSLRINIGDHLYQEGDEDSYLEIKQIIIHPEYQSGWYYSFPYDFCMVQTKEKMIIDGVKTQVACFPEAGVHVDGNEAECWTAGWGMVSLGYPAIPLQLQTLKVNIYDDEVCFNHVLNHNFAKKSESAMSNDSKDIDDVPKFDHYDSYNGYDGYGYDGYGYDSYGNNNLNYTEEHGFYNSEVEFCAGHYNVTTDTYTADASSCFGDSGGPLVCIYPNSTEPKLYGIVSWGYECGEPSFYAKTSAVIDWFDDVITGKYPPDPCDDGVCQMPEDIVSPGNKWFSNDLSENNTERKKRDVVLEEGEIAREGSWPWVVGIKGNPKQDYCHVKVLTTENLCADESGEIDITYAQFEDIDIEYIKNELEIWDIAMFSNGTIGGSGYDFDISFFNESEIYMVDDPCSAPYGHHLVCQNTNDSRIDNGIIVTDKWILTSATACLNFYNNPSNDYFIHAGAHNLTESGDGLAIKNYHIYAKEGEQNQEFGCNQHDDYCLIELETSLVITENILAIGFQHFTSSSTTTTTTNTLPTKTTTTKLTPTTTESFVTIIPTWDSTWLPWLTTTTNTETKPTPSNDDTFDKCWIAAWSDNNLRTFKVDINPYCYWYYPSEFSPFLKHKLSSEQKVEHKKRIEAHKNKLLKKMGNKNDNSNISDEPELPQIFNEYYGVRSHICIDNLRNPEHLFENPGGPLVCLNAQNEPVLMGMIDTSGFYQAVYDRVEYALSWMDRVITGEEFSSCSPAQTNSPNDNDGNCRFYRDGNLTVFQTPTPYLINMECKQNFTCLDPANTVQYEFEYFETELGYDKLFVNGVVYQGYSVPTNVWIDSYTSHVDLFFISDDIYPDYGFKMNLKCDIPNTPEPTSNEVTTGFSYDTCYFEDFGDAAILDTGSPYQNDMRCHQTFGCMNINETVHFKFDQFETERNFDFLVIGNPYEFDQDYDEYFGENNDYSDDYRTKPYNRTGLMLDGMQQTNIWVTAESIQNFDIYFYSDYSVVRSGVRMIMECRVPLPSTPDAFDIYSSTDITTVITNTWSTPTTTGSSTTTTESTQYMKLTGSITTAYSFSDDLNDPESDMFKSYASTIESEMSSIMMKSSMMKSVNLEVTGFQAVGEARKKRQATETKAMAEFEAIAEVPGDVVMEEVQGSVENEIQSASDDGLDSLDADSFNTIGVVVETTKVITTTVTTTTTTVTTTTTTAATTTTTMKTTLETTTTATTTTSSRELASISTCPGGNDWFKIDQSNSVSWSWQVSISIGRRASAGLFSCSGVILTSDWILTAADCCIGSIVDEMEVYTGSLDFNHGTMHKVQYYKTENEICAIRLDDKIDINGKTTSVGCFKDDSSDDDCWMAAWQHKVMTHDRQNRLNSKSVAISDYGSTGISACDLNSNTIDYTGSPVMCQVGSISYISGVVWEDKGCQSYTREVLVYESSLMRSWIADTIENDQNMPPAQPESSEVSPDEILETVQSVFNFLGDVFNFLAEREKNSQD